MAKRVVIMMCLVLFLTHIVAFAGGKQETTAKEKGEITTLRLWDPETRPGGKDARDAYIAKFMQNHPDIKVDLTIVGWGQMHEKIIAASAANSLPDIFLGFTAFPATYFAQGITQDVTDIIEAVGVDQFSEAHKRGSAIDGKWFSVPFVIVPHVFFYRTDWVKEAGLGAPDTWDKWLRMAKALTSGDRYGVVGYLNPRDLYYIANLAATARATTFDENLNITMDTPQWIDTLRFLKEIWKYTQPGSNNLTQVDARLSFLADAGASIMSSVSFGNEIAQKDINMLDNVTAIPIPRSTKHKSEFTGWGPNALGYVVSKSANRDAAKAYLVEFMSHENQLEYAKETAIGFVAVRKSVQESQEYLNYPRLKPFRAFTEAAIKAEPGGLNTGHPFGPNKYGGAILGQSVYSRMAQKLLIDNDSPEEIVKWAQETVEKIVKEMQ
jgi:multiple sugar transport system substrate-binding protein